MKKEQTVKEMKESVVEAIREKELPEEFINYTIGSCADLLEELTDGLQGTVEILKALSDRQMAKAEFGAFDDLEEIFGKAAEMCEKDDKEKDPEDRDDKEAENLSPADIYPSVVVYVPGLTPGLGTEGMVDDLVDLSDPRVKEIRFKETDFLIAFDAGNIRKLWNKYYLTGPAVIYAVDDRDEIRPLTFAEIMKIRAVLEHLEEKVVVDGKGRPVFAVC